MTKKAFRTLRLLLLITVILLALVGILHVTDLMGADTAKDIAIKTLMGMGVVAAASIAILFLSGGGDSK